MGQIFTILRCEKYEEKWYTVYVQDVEIWVEMSCTVKTNSSGLPPIMARSSIVCVLLFIYIQGTTASSIMLIYNFCVIAFYDIETYARSW